MNLHRITRSFGCITSVFVMLLAGSATAVFLLSVAMLVAPAASAAPPPPPISYQEHIVAKFVNSVGGVVLFRRGYYLGGRGFGYDKTNHKHNLRGLGTIGTVVRFPSVVRQEGPGTWVHERRFCEIAVHKCRPNYVTIRVVINYHGWLGSGQHGIVTAYCLGMTRCPEWANYNALLV